MPPLSNGRPSNRFGLFCVASFLLSISYGATFLVSLLVSSLGELSAMQGRSLPLP